MRVVNLSRKPFVNRRPVVRLTVALWLVGAVLLGLNVTLYRDYWLGTAENRERLATAEQSIEEQLQELKVQDGALSQIRLTRQNRKAVYLNSLITRRTFPWSDLFDRLEEVTPNDVRLVSVRPVVKLALDIRRPDEAGRAAAASVSSAEDLPADQVALRLSGWAKSEEALATFVNTLYREPVFGPPDLKNEVIDTESGSQIRFSLDTSFLIGSSEPEAQVAEITPPEDGTSEGAEEEATEVATNDETENPLAGDPPGDTPEAQDGLSLAVTTTPPPPPRRSAAPPSAPPKRNPEVEEATRQEVEAARQGAFRREPRRETEPSEPPGKDRQQYLEALRARAAARGRGTRAEEPASSGRGTTAEGNNTRPTQENAGSAEGSTRPTRPAPPPPPRPTGTKPPASSTPRVNGISWRIPEDHLPPYRPSSEFPREEEARA